MNAVCVAGYKELKTSGAILADDSITHHLFASVTAENVFWWFTQFILAFLIISFTCMHSSFLCISGISLHEYY